MVSLHFWAFLIGQCCVASASVGPWLSGHVLPSSCRAADSPVIRIRGGARKAAYRLLASAIRGRFDEEVELSKIEKALSSLANAQQILKGLDGAAHEAYQRTHRSSAGQVSEQVSGRARRSAARAGSTADALLAAELCELLENPGVLGEELSSPENGTLGASRKVVADLTSVRMSKNSNISFMVLYEAEYSGGAGLDHGGIEDLGASKKGKVENRGRLFVIVSDDARVDLTRTIDVLASEPLQVELNAGLVANEVASVQPELYRAASRLLNKLEPLLTQEYNSTQIAVHFVGRSLAGGVASLAATILDGSLPLPASLSGRKKRKTKSRSKKTTSNGEGESSAAMDKNSTSIDGLGRGRSSAVALGPPPCISSNLRAAFVKSIVYGDDVVCRATHESIERLLSRTKRSMKGGFLGRQVGWMTDTMSLTASSLRSHAQGSEGEEGRLSVAGQVYLVRPRRLGGACSIHEVGSQKGGREALREKLLWQLNDVLLSDSLWKHHQLESYIHGLDRVQLRGFEDDAV